jgi:hypothetical protein
MIAVPKIVAFPVAAAVKLDVVVVKKNSTVDGSETSTSKGPFPLEADVKVRDRRAEGGLGKSGLLRCRTPLSICRLKYLVAGAAAANCWAGSQTVPLPRLDVGAPINRGPGVGTIEEYINGVLPAAKDWGVHVVGVEGSSVRGGRTKFSNTLLKLMIRWLPRSWGNDEAAADMIVNVFLQQNGRGCGRR